MTTNCNGPLFYVSIPEETFSETPMRWLADYASPEMEYPVVGLIGDKLLLVNDRDQLFELFPRKCRFAGYDSPEK